MLVCAAFAARDMTDKRRRAATLNRTHDFELVQARLGVDTSKLCVVACHLWDTIGAQSVGCQGAFIARPNNSVLHVPRRQLKILRAATQPNEIDPEDMDNRYDLIVDGMIGYSLSGGPRGRARKFVAQSANLDCAKLSLDVPSGFDASSGTLAPGAFRADATLTLALPKFGLSAPANSSHVGDLYCADISVPPALYSRLDPPIAVPLLFAKSDIVRLA